METARPPKIDQKILHRLLVSEGYSQRQAADYFAVSEAAVSKCVKKLNINLNRHVGMERAKEVADYGLDVVRQLKDINHTIRQELQWATHEARREDGDRKGLQRVIVELSSEVRKQLGFQLEVLRSLYDFQAAAEFQQEVLDAIGEVSPETRQAIIQRLTQGRTLRSALAFPHGN
jgi:predicted transcriptional regulator